MVPSISFISLLLINYSSKMTPRQDTILCDCYLCSMKATCSINSSPNTRYVDCTTICSISIIHTCILYAEIYDCIASISTIIGSLESILHKFGLSEVIIESADFSLQVPPLSFSYYCSVLILRENQKNLKFWIFQSVFAQFHLNAVQELNELKLEYEFCYKTLNLSSPQ